MSVMEAEVYAAFKSIGIADDKASYAAQALSRRDTDLDILKSSFAVLKCMVGFALALQVGIMLSLWLPLR